ncbi:hypothetical protein MBENS4_4371 [Novosphingobium sp. MBES04]|nr:hypothetical protein MBENS4_4371 [Novosphingobium sp. MBES04]
MPFEEVSGRPGNAVRGKVIRRSVEAERIVGELVRNERALARSGEDNGDVGLAPPGTERLAGRGDKVDRKAGVT